MMKSPNKPPPPNMKLTYLNLCGAGARQVWLRNSDRDAILKGEVSHFQNGLAGLSFACGLANVWQDPNNRSRFSHGIKFADIIKTRAYIVTGEYGGILTVVAYAHSHGALIDMND